MSATGNRWAQDDNFAVEQHLRELLDQGAKTAFRFGHTIIYEPLAILPNALWYKDRRWGISTPWLTLKQTLGGSK